MKIFNISDDIVSAAQKNDLDTVRKLSKNYNLDFRDKNGKTALFYAVENENIEMCKFLISKKVNLYMKDDRNLMAIHYAVMLKNNEIIELFKENGINISIHIIEDESKGISIKDERKLLNFIKKIF